MGQNLIPRLAKDLSAQFPEMRGLSARNLGYMKAFAEAWPEEAILQEPLAKLPWGHNVRLLDLLKDPYNFDFLTLAEDAHEREVETGLVEHIQRFLLELGVGFAFAGRQYPLDIGGKDYRLDLLFYHLKLRCFVVIDLKGGEFKPEYAGKMNFYLAAVDDTLKHPADQPSIGLILCKSKTEVVVEYALRGTTTPMGIAEFPHLLKLPEEFRGSLPTIEEIEAELRAEAEPES